jgi:hypothetical protein
MTETSHEQETTTMTHTEKHEFGQSLEADLDHVRREAMRGHESDAPAFVPQPAPTIAERIDAEIASHQPTAPFPELEAEGSDAYDLCVWLTFTVNHYPGGVGVDAPPAETREYCIESGRSRGTWSLRVSPWTGSMTDDDVTGPPLVELRRQTEGPDPLSLLRALLTGGA